MAVAKKRNFSSSSMESPNSLYTFFTEMGVPATVSGSWITISFSENLQVQIDCRKAGYGAFFTYVTVKGTQNYVIAPSQGSTVTCIYGEKIFYLLIEGVYDSRKACVFIEQIGNEWFYGSNGSNASGFVPINNLSLYRIDDTAAYNHRTILNYSAPLNTINFTNDFIFNSSIKYAADNNTLSCTSTSAGNVITFNGNNYFALSANTLVLLDG